MSVSELRGPHLSRFIMKSEWPLFELQTPFYQFALNARWWGFRLTPAVSMEAQALSYNSFGSFRVGAMDLISSRAYALPVQYDNQPVNEDPEHWGYEGNLYTQALGTGRTRLFARFNQRWEPGILSAVFDFDETSPSFDLHLKAVGFEGVNRIRFPVYGQYLFPEIRGASGTGGFYTADGRTGLMAVGREDSDITTRSEPHRSIIELNLYPPRTLHTRLTVFSESVGTDQVQPSPPAPIDPNVSAARSWDTWPEWEVLEMFTQGWIPDRTGAKQRVAGLFVSTPLWGHKSSIDPNTDVFHIEKFFLPRLIETGAFQAVGLSRDGIYEKGLQAPWQRLVRQTRQAGLTAYMKPGDQELEQLSNESGKALWLKDNFDVPEEARCTIVRLCWESLLRAWSTADTALAPKYVPPHLASSLTDLPWREAEARLVSHVADLFSYFIDGIRTYAPDTVIDLECGDTRVFRTLMARHDRLGIQYMCYGHYPRVMDYLDLYYNLARNGLGAERVVLETDAYYTHDFHELDLLRSAPPEEIYDKDALELLKKKHAGMMQIGAEAVWAWGVNLNDCPEKFEAICFPEPSMTSVY